jgi:hypothetical protein
VQCQQVGMDLTHNPSAALGPKQLCDAAQVTHPAYKHTQGPMTARHTPKHQRQCRFIFSAEWDMGRACSAVETTDMCMPQHNMVQ